MPENVQDWLAEQICLFTAEQPSYQAYADALQVILEAAVSAHAPLGIVQTRPKSLSSFSEKALRKYDKYKNPLDRMTDLCGARVITVTQHEASAISDFIRGEFIIDVENSQDVSDRLGVSEFGYRSLHFVVQCKGGNILGVAIPPEIGARKAEIQVRTLLQHAWSEIAHDRIYKTNITVPQPFRREAARLAAIMEQAELAFGNLVESIDVYARHYDAYMDADRMAFEINMLNTLLANERHPESRVAIALRIARIARSTSDWKTIIETLQPFLEFETPHNTTVKKEMGNALCQVHRDTPRNPEYNQGQRLIEQALAADPFDSESAEFLAASWQRVQYNEEKSRELYRRAHEGNPGDPYHLVAFIEYEIHCNRNPSILSPLGHVLRQAIHTCHNHIAVGIELPRAWFTMGKLHLLLGEANEAIAAFLNGISYYSRETCSLPEDSLEAEIEALLRLRPVAHALPGNHPLRPNLLACAHRLLLLAKSIKYHAASPLQELVAMRIAEYDPARPLLLIAGGCDATIEPKIRTYEEALYTALRTFNGIIISGATDAGVAGLVGAIAARIGPRGSRPFQLIGYHPERIPTSVRLDSRYDTLHKTTGNDLTIMEAVQGWIDIIASNINPARVQLIGINGGPIAALEYRMALALGATVCVLNDSGREADRIQQDPHWREMKTHIAAPADGMTIAAFLNAGHTGLTEEVLDRAGQAAHAEYLRDRKPVYADPAMNPWDKLPQTLKQSNRMQAAYALKILNAIGCNVSSKPAAEIIPINDFTDSEIEIMAEMEHGRWTMERLRDGWRLGKKDVSRKLSPYLVGWSDLDDGVKEWDREAVRNFPRMFKEVGMEIYRTGAPQGG